MTARIEVAFKGNRKDFYLWDSDDPPLPRTAIIVEADRGEDLGHVHEVEGHEKQRRFNERITGDGLDMLKDGGHEGEKEEKPDHLSEQKAEGAQAVGELGLHRHRGGAQ